MYAYEVEDNCVNEPIHSLSGCLGTNTFCDFIFLFFFFFEIECYILLFQTFIYVVIRKMNTQVCDEIIKQVSGQL